jgi:hypothetical protein
MSKLKQIYNGIYKHNERRSGNLSSPQRSEALNPNEEMVWINQQLVPNSLTGENDFLVSEALYKKFCQDTIVIWLKASCVGWLKISVSV